MASRLKEELKQSLPFSSLEEETVLSLARTSALLEHLVSEVLRPYNITATQYNVLRILRGAGSDGMCRNDVGDRMLTVVPDMTRLLDRMEEAGLVERERDPADRRMVRTRITAAGQKILKELDEPVRQFHRARLGHMSREDLRALIALLDGVRAGLTDE